MPSIDVRHLSKSFRKAGPVLDDVTFRYEGPGAIGYLGPNGAGKTTTLKLLVGLLRPTGGRALLNGLEVTENRQAALWDVGALIETPEPYPTQSVAEALRTVGQIRSLSREGIDFEIARLHEELKLPPLERRCGALSKGQRQRVALAAALIGDPSVLLLDEPSSALDPAERVLVRNLLGRLKKDHLILLVSHQVADIAEVCDDVLILDRGHVVLKDHVENVIARAPSRQLDVEFLRAVPLAAFSAFGADVGAVERLSDLHYRLRFDGSEEARGRILAGCLRLGPIAQFSNATLALEDAYLQLLNATPGPPAVVGSG
ncbi:MAG: ABC transporter ATP-binding protein [Thermoplasmata archaeon]|nr:ABC transporter ATP-binding protein [Thermoplasmata archaeon]